MNTRVISLLVGVLLLSGVATASAQPPTDTLTGVWEGIITGRDMATAQGVDQEYVRLVVNEDGTWTMRTATWQASGRITSRTQSFVLEGDFISGNPGHPDGPALYYLSQWRNSQVLGGNATTHWKGTHTLAGITLKKIQ